MRAVIEGIQRYAINYWGLPRWKTAECDACGNQAHAFGYVEQAAIEFRATGWLIEEDLPTAQCICPPCASMIYVQIWSRLTPMGWPDTPEMIAALKGLRKAVDFINAVAAARIYQRGS